MALPPGTWLKLTVFLTGDAKEFSNVFWFDGAAGAQPANFDPDGLAAAADTWSNGVYGGYLSDEITRKGAQIECNFGGGTFGGVSAVSAAGPVSGAALPEDVAVVVRKQTATGGRSGAGRYRFSGVPETNADGSYLNTAGLTAFADVKTGCIATFTDQGITWTPQHYSPLTNTLMKITGLGLDPLLGTIRRRRPRF